MSNLLLCSVKCITSSINVVDLFLYINCHSSYKCSVVGREGSQVSEPVRCGPAP